MTSLKLLSITFVVVLACTKSYAFQLNNSTYFNYTNVTNATMLPSVVQFALDDFTLVSKSSKAPKSSEIKSKTDADSSGNKSAKETRIVSNKAQIVSENEKEENNKVQSTPIYSPPLTVTESPVYYPKSYEVKDESNEKSAKSDKK